MVRKSSMTRIPIPRLPWLIWTRFESLGNSSETSSKQMFIDILGGFDFVVKMYVYCVYSLESPHRCDFNEYTQRTIILQKIGKISIYYSHLSPDLVVWLTLSGSNYLAMSGTNFHGLKDVRAIEVITLMFFSVANPRVILIRLTHFSINTRARVGNVFSPYILIITLRIEMSYTAKYFSKLSFFFNYVRCEGRGCLVS